MRALEDALARIARRDELRERANGSRGGAHRVDDPSPDQSATPSVSPVVDEVAEALQAVVRRNPGVFATVVVQEADTAWSVWIGEWDGTLRTRVTRLDPDPPAAGAAPHAVEAVAIPEPAPEPASEYVPEPVVPPAPVPGPRQPAHDRNESYAPLRAANAHTPADPGTYQTAAPPLRAVTGPAMNDRVAGRIAELLRREASRESRGIDA
jgi:hypothetical protein